MKMVGHSKTFWSIITIGKFGNFHLDCIMIIIENSSTKTIHNDRPHDRERKRIPVNLIENILISVSPCTFLNLLPHLLYPENILKLIIAYSDVEPFLEAVQNMTDYYEDRNVDIFKQAISGYTNIEYQAL